MKLLYILSASILIVSSCMHSSKNIQARNSSSHISDTMDHNSLRISNNNFPDRLQDNGTKNDSSHSVFIVDSSDYSVTFMKSLKPENAFRQFYLDSNIFIFSSSDTAWFPDNPSFGKVIIFSNKKGNIEINLIVKRIFQSTIEYTIELIDNNKQPIIKTGIADLSPNFFVGSELDEDSNGHPYESTEYFDINDNYITSIRIGCDPKNQNLLIGKIICSIGPLRIDLKNFPALLEKH
jgi:hypothetical protein